jgi:hypothetical protein
MGPPSIDEDPGDWMENEPKKIWRFWLKLGLKSFDNL